MSVLRWLPRFRRIDRSLRQYEERESWSSCDIEGYQLDRLNRVWSHAREHVPHYVELAASQDLPDRFESIKHFTQVVPVLSKDDVRQQPAQFLSDQPQPGTWHRSGGSTGTPTNVYWEHEAHREMLRGKYRSEQAHGLDVFDRKVIFWGHAGSYAPGWRGTQQRLLRPVEDRLRNRFRLSAYDITDKTLQQQIPIVQKFNPQSIYGYSCAVHLLSRAAKDIQIENLKVAILTAEPACHDMLGEVESNFGCRAVIEYGAVECGLMAYTMPDGKLRTRDDLVLVETLPNAHGHYDIVITVLGNASFPLLRYSIEDTTTAPRMTNDVGFGILKSVHGRSNDWLIGKNGCKLHSMAVKHRLERWPEIRRFTVWQRSAGDVRVVIEPQTVSRLSERLIASLRCEIQEMLEGFPVEIETVANLPVNQAGKHRWIVSELAASSMT